VSFWSSRNVLVTGGASFIGSHLVERLVAEGARVWEYFNLVDEGLLAVVEEAQRLPASFTRAFFEAARGRCGETRAH
jgi:nucleoside-diphosphate-sugar epimerase